MGFLIAYYLLTIEIALATHTVGISEYRNGSGATGAEHLGAIGTLCFSDHRPHPCRERYMLFDVVVQSR